jgi:mevalonate kinase
MTNTNKTKYIKQLQAKIKHDDEIITKTNQQILEIENRLRTYIPKNHAEFRQSVKFTRSLVHLINRNNELLARTTLYHYNIKKAELSTAPNHTTLKLPQLEQYIEYIEELSKKELFP